MGAFHSLRYRDYRLLWTGAVLSNIGLWMHNVALSWYVLLLTKSAFWVGAVSFANFIPGWFAPIGGVVADRLERRTVLFATQTLMMLGTVGIAVLVSTGHATVWNLLGLTFVLGGVFAFNGPTWQAFVPALVPREAMVNAIALNSAQFSMARVIGPSIAGILIASRGVSPVFWINAISYGAVLIALGFIRTRTERKPSVERPLASLVAGFRYAWSRPVLRAMIGSMAVVSLFGFPTTSLLPVYAKEVFGRGSGAYGALASAMGFGSVAGALILGRRGRAHPPQIFAMIAVLGVALAGFAAAARFEVGLVMMAVFGVAYLFSISSINSQIQTTVDEAYRGRVMSLFMLAFGGLAPFGSLISGAVAQATSVHVPTLAGSAVCITWGLMLSLWWRRAGHAEVALA